MLIDNGLSAQRFAASTPNSEKVWDQMLVPKRADPVGPVVEPAGQRSKRSVGRARENMVSPTLHQVLPQLERIFTPVGSDSPVAGAMGESGLGNLRQGALPVPSRPADALHGGRSGSAAGLASWVRRSLVVAQVALCSVPLVGAAVFLRTSSRSARRSCVFDPANVLNAAPRFRAPPTGRATP